MTIKMNDPKFSRFHGMTADEIASERDRLRAEAVELSERSDLQGADADRFDALADDLEYLKARDEQRSRILGLVGDGAVERGTPFPVAKKEARAELKDALTLSRDQSMTSWSRDNGHSKDAEGANFDTYLRGLVTGDWSGATVERALAEGTNSAGGYLVPTPLANQIVDLARNATRVIQAGALTVPMTAQTLRIPRLIGEGAPAWRNENAAITAGDLTFDAVTLKAQSLDRLVILSNELFQDSNPSASDIIAKAFAAQIAAEIDRVALRGTGTSPEPRGILNTAGVTVTNHGANGTALSNYDWVLDSVGAVRNANFEPTAVLAAPRTQTALSKLKDSQGRYLDAPTGLPTMYPTKQIPTNLTVGTSNLASEIYTGDFSQLVIGIRSGFTLRLLSEKYADTGQVAFLANMRADVVVLQPSAFAVDLGVL